MKPIHIRSSDVRFLAYFIIVPAAVMVITGCLANYGKIRGDLQVNSAFEAGTPLPDHQYYYNGRKSMPYAIVGIREGVAFNTWGWAPIDTAAGELPKMVERMYHPGYDEPYGGVILDHQGQKIGVWFSQWRQTAVRMDSQNQVTIVSPYNPNRLNDFPRR